MTTTVDKNVLAKAIGVTVKAVGANPVISLLSNILFESGKKSSRVAATNLEIGISYAFPSKGKVFSTCIPAKTIANLIDALHTEEIDLEQDTANQSIIVMTENSTSTIMCAPPDEFPDIPFVTEPTFTLPVVQFKEMVQRVAFASSAKIEHQGSPLSGVQVSIEDGLFILFAVDGFHLCYEEFPLSSENITEHEPFIIKGTTLDMISKTLPDEGDLEVQVEENKAMFHCGDVNVITQLLSGAFPSHKQLKDAIQKPGTVLKIPTVELLRAVRQLRVFAAETGASLLSTNGMLVRYSSVSQEKGNSDTTFAAIKKGKDIKVGINVNLLYQFLEVCKTEIVSLEMENEKSPLLFKMEGFDSFYHVIMPIVL